MAKTKQWTPRRVRSEEERGSGSSDYIQLDEGEKFLGYALFEADPAKDEKGYYEFLQHWNTAARRSVPCAGDDCPFCEDGDKPKDVANTLWLVTKDVKGNDLGDGELRIFKANSIVIKQLTEMRSEDEPIKGVQFRVTRMDDRGNYMLQPKAKKLTATQVKEHLKDKDAPDFDAMVTSQLKRAMEGVSIARAVDDDDEEDDDVKGKSKPKASGKASAKKTKDAGNEWPTDDELADEEVTVTKVEKEGQWIEVTSDDYEGKIKVWTTDDIEFDLSDLSKGDTVTITADGPDDDGDYILNAEPEVEGGGGEEKEDIEDETLELVSVKKSKNSVVVEWQDEEVTLVGGDDVDVSDFKKGQSAKISASYDSDEEEWTLDSIEEPEEEEENGDGAELPDLIEDEEFLVGDIDLKESTMEVTQVDGDLAFTLYFLDKGPSSKVDFDDYEEGAKISVSAKKDSVGDMVATAVPTVVEEEKKSAKKGSGKSSGKKGGKKTAGKGGKGKK
jgi:hypothetical protein